MATTQLPVTGDTLITIKISLDDGAKRLKLPLKDLNAETLPVKLRQLLALPADKGVTFERFSDSAGGFVVLDPTNPTVFKTLVRAAKAKLKLRLRASITANNTTQTASEPMMASEQETMNTPRRSERLSTALNSSSVGPGIFDYKAARTDKHQERTAASGSGEAPVPKPFAVPTPGSLDQLAFRPRVVSDLPFNATQRWTVFCNECDQAMSNEHFHCGLCEGGDFDICADCVSNGKLCPGDGHWLIKRSIKDGAIVSSTTERLPPKLKKETVAPIPVKIETPKEMSVPTEFAHKEPSSKQILAIENLIKKEMPGAFTDDTKTLVEEHEVPSRTCNSCVEEKTEEHFVTCTVCDDHDICLPCFEQKKDGHNPAHAFAKATVEAKVSNRVEAMMQPGRGTVHLATCDRCDKRIVGVRHKCFNCPDYDVCHDCYGSARTYHPGHRFAEVYRQIGTAAGAYVKHTGIYCDGPRCTRSKNQNYITGIRYKCVVCDDTDFCADCEAAPGTFHNLTHPLLKIRSPIRGLDISTVNQTADGRVFTGLGDRRSSAEVKLPTSEASEPLGNVVKSGPTSIKTVADIKPSPCISSAPPANQCSVPTVPLLTVEQMREQAAARARAMPSMSSLSQGLNAIFVQDSVKDGSQMAAGSRFVQTWTLRNPGPQPWPNGCSLCFVGGDNMLAFAMETSPYAVGQIDHGTSNTVSRTILPGEEMTFHVSLRAPQRLGKAISYWRIKTADGTPFGHRLWCDIEVVRASTLLAPGAMQTPFGVSQASAPAPPSVPAPMDCRFDGAIYARMEQIRRQQQEQFTKRQQEASRLVQENRKRQLDAMKMQQESVKRYAMPPHPFLVASASASTASFNEELQKLQQRVAELSTQQSRESPKSLKERLRSHAQATAEARAASSSSISSKRASGLAPVIGSSKSSAQAQLDAHKAQIEAAKAQVQKTLDQVKEDSRVQMQEAARYASQQQVAKAQAAISALKSPKDGNMVFPTLEKESPSSSIYQSAPVSEDGKGKGKAAYVDDSEIGTKIAEATKPAAAPIETEGYVAATETSEPEAAAPVQDEFEDVSDEIEILSAEDDLSEDDGFLTDEEYDILDASDQETVVSSS